MGFKGLMLVGQPDHEDYHHPDYDPFYEAVVDMGLPLSFHILTSRRDMVRDYRGQINHSKPSSVVIKTSSGRSSSAVCSSGTRI